MSKISQYNLELTSDDMGTVILQRPAPKCILDTK